MNLKFQKLFTWFDNKTNNCLWSKPFSEGLALQTSVPKCMQDAFKAFKKCNKQRRISLASDFINQVNLPYEES
jgi:hypothetical protein